MREFLRKLFTKKTITIAGVAIGAAILFFLGATAYYYIRTPADTVIVDTRAFPAGLNPPFSQDNLTDQVVARLQKMVETPPIPVPGEKPRSTFGPASIKEKTVPVRALSSGASPVFDLSLRGINLNLCRRIGMHAKARWFLELGVIGMPDNKGWRLTALLKKDPHLESTGSAPLNGGPCVDFEGCAQDLAQQIMPHLDIQRLLRYAIRINTPESNRLIVGLYNSFGASSLKADDFVTWGNAYYELGQFDEALKQFQAALKIDPNYCPAKVARGFVYFKRARGTEELRDLKYAENDFREGVACDPNNKLTLNALGHTLLKKWVNSPKAQRDPKFLAEAKEYSEKALAIDPDFAVASVNAAYILFRQEKRAEALTRLENLSLKYPTDGYLFLNYGFLLYLEYLDDGTQATLNQAIAQTYKAWERIPTSPIALNNLGFFYYEAGNYVQAVEFWKKANERDANDPDSLAGLALGYFRMGDRVSAITLITRAIQIEPNVRNPAYVKEHFYWSSKAVSDLGRLLRLLPSSRSNENKNSTTAQPSGRTL